MVKNTIISMGMVFHGQHLRVISDHAIRFEP